MKNIKLLLIISCALVLGACSLNVRTSGIGSSDGGVFVTNNKGDVWRQMPFIPTITGSPGSIANIDIRRMYIDPSDSGTIYLATDKNGLYYTHNVGRGWNKVHDLPGNATINDVAIDSREKCTVFVAIDNLLYKTSDCNRSFTQVYHDNNPGVLVTAVAIDHYNNNVVYLGTSRGDVLRSLDGGNSWRAIQRLSDRIEVILIKPSDSRSVFVTTAKNGIFKFNSAGGATLDQLSEYRNHFDNTNWTDYRNELREFNLGINFTGITYSEEDNSLLLATDRVILRSFDEGESWIRLSLLTPDQDSKIRSIAVNPKDGKEIFYATDTSFFRSQDGGDSWSVRRLPTTRSGSYILVDYNNPNIMYLGIRRPN
jgi:photosystem II stability/assembly factor-like uncharacterized protein